MPRTSRAAAKQGTSESAPSPAPVPARRAGRRRWLLAGLALPLLAVAAGCDEPFEKVILRPRSHGWRPNAVGVIDPETNRLVGQVRVVSANSPRRRRGRGLGLERGRSHDLAGRRRRSADRHTIPLSRTAASPPASRPARAPSGWAGTVWAASLSRINPSFDEIAQTMRSDARRSRSSPSAGRSRSGRLDLDRRPAFRHGAPDRSARNEDRRPHRRRHPARHAFRRRGAPGPAAAGTSSSASTLARTRSTANGRSYRRSARDRDRCGSGLGHRRRRGCRGADRYGDGRGTTQEVGDFPTAVAVGHGSVWVANAGDGTVSRIDPETREIVATIRLGASPEAIAVADRVVLVATSGTGDAVDTGREATSCTSQGSPDRTRRRR